MVSFFLILYWYVSEDVFILIIFLKSFLENTSVFSVVCLMYDFPPRVPDEFNTLESIDSHIPLKRPIFLNFSLDCLSKPKLLNLNSISGTISPDPGREPPADEGGLDKNKLSKCFFSSNIDMLKIVITLLLINNNKILNN